MEPAVRTCSNMISDTLGPSNIFFHITCVNCSLLSQSTYSPAAVSISKIVPDKSTLFSLFAVCNYLSLFKISLTLSLCSVSSVSGMPIQVLALIHLLCQCCVQTEASLFLHVCLYAFSDLFLAITLLSWSQTAAPCSDTVKRFDLIFPGVSGRSWPQLSRISRCLRRSVCWRARRRSEACTRSSGTGAQHDSLWQCRKC